MQCNPQGVVCIACKHARQYRYNSLTFDVFYAIFSPNSADSTE